MGGQLELEACRSQSFLLIQTAWNKSYRMGANGPRLSISKSGSVYVCPSSTKCEVDSYKPRC